jgi:hypothetical protein
MDEDSGMAGTSRFCFGVKSLNDVSFSSNLSH